MGRKKNTYRKTKKPASKKPIIKKQASTSKVKLTDRKVLLSLLALVLFTLITYFPAFQNQITNWDDDQYITTNPILKELSAANIGSMFAGEQKYYMGNYHPLSMLSLAVDYQISGENKEGEIAAWMFHFTNNILHVINSLLVFYLVFFLIGRFEFSLIVAALFALTTLHVESVAWISERKDVLYTAFFLASLISYVRYVKLKKTGLYALSLFLFVLSLLAKGQAVSLAVSLVTIDFFLKRKLLTKQVILEKIPYFLLALAFGIMAIQAQSHGEAIHDITEFPFWYRIFFAAYSYTIYIVKLFMPYKLSAIYPYPNIMEGLPAYFYLFLLPVLGTIYLFIKNLQKNKALAFGIAFYAVNIFLLLQLIPVGSAIMADRYAYIPSIGIFIIFAYYIEKFYKMPKYKMLVRLTSSIYLIGIAFLSFQQNKTWENSMSVWDNTIKNSPRAVVAWNNRGSTKEKNKDFEGAIADFTQAINVKADYVHAWYNRGTAKKDMNRYVEAIKDFSKAIELDNEFSEAFHNRGICKDNLGDLEGAIADFNLAIRNKPEYDSPYVNRGVAKGKLGRFKEAIVDFKLALKLNPDNSSAYSNTGLALERTGDLEGAIKSYDKAIELDNQFVTAYSNRGIAKKQKGEDQAAIEDFSMAIRLNPSFAEAYYNRGLSKIKLNKRDAGCQDLQKAKQLGLKSAEYALQRYCANGSSQ